MLLAFLEVVDPAGEVVVVGLDGGTARGDAREALAAGPRPARLLGPLGYLLWVGLALVAHVDRRRRPLEHVQLADHLGDLGDDLHGGGTGADDAHPLAFEVDVVVPARRVERLAREGSHAVDAGQLRAGEDAVGQDHVAGLHGVAAVGADGPAAGLLVPHRGVDGGVEQALVVEAELVGHRLAVLENLEARGELHRGDVLHLLEQRQVAVRLHIAGDARVAVPVPSAADVAALLAEPHVGEAGAAQLVPQQQPGEPGADAQHLALVVECFAFDRRLGIDVVEVALELALHGHVVGSAPARFLEVAVLGLLFGVEHGAGRGRGQLLQMLIGVDRVAHAVDLL